jgi:fibronectin type 3 domain-containing protein
VASAYEVNLTWDPPASSADPVAGYDVYRSADGGGSYQELNSSPLTQPAYTDSNVQDGVVYTYYVESADASGVQSSPSNLLVVTIP